MLYPTMLDAVELDMLDPFDRLLSSNRVFKQIQHVASNNVGCCRTGHVGSV